MSLARASVGRPVFALMITMVVIVLGGAALSRLQIDLLPSIELPTITVRTSFDGADPLVMERLVTQIVEEIVATVPGVVEMTSSSYEGNSRIRVSFAWGTDVDTAAIEVRATLEDEINELPDDIGSVRVSKFDVDSFPVVLLGISSKLNPVELTEIVENQIRYRFSRITGVAQVDPWGGFNREIRIELDPARINALGLPLNDVLQAIRNANLDLPAGKIEEGSYQMTLRAPAEFSNLDQIRSTVVGRNDDNLITLRQIASVQDTYQTKSRIIRVNGQQGLRVAIRKQPGENTVEVAGRVLDEVDAINDAFPQIEVIPVINQGNFIERAISNVTLSVLYGGSLAIFILLFFLRNLRSTMVISLAIPVSVIATFAMLYAGGFTLNLMSLGGLALGVGMMVDSSVVVLENIFRRKQTTGEDSKTAAINGTREVSSAVIAGTITTLVIFLPLIFMKGVSGIMFRELAYVIMFSLLCALLVSLSLVPVMSSSILARTSSSSPSKGWLMTRLESGYQWLLSFSLKWRWSTLLLCSAIFGSSLLLTEHIGTEFIPPSDEGEVRVTGEMEVGTRIDLIDQQTRLLEKKVFEAVPEAVATVTSVAASGTFGRSAASGEIRLSLVPAKQRQRSNTEIASDLRTLLEGTIPGMTVRVRAPQGQFLLDRILPNVDGVDIEVRGFDLDTLGMLSRRVRDSISDVPGITDVQLSRDAGIPQQEIVIDREKAADLGLSVRDVTEVIETAVAGSNAGEYRVDGNSYRILLQLKDAERLSIDEILDLVIRTDSGELIALRNLISTKRGSGPVTIERKDQQRLITVKTNVSGRDLGAVARDIQDRLDTIARPMGFELLISGTFEEQEQAFTELLWSLMLALALVYMVLAAQYESYIDPLIVMFSTPFAATGVIITLFLTDTTMNLQSGIGCILLGGIVVNNAILLVDQTNQFRRSGMSTIQSLKETGTRRLRPVLMTTLTTILALLPLALGIGEGADAQAPMARAVVGGLTVSTLITLVLIPVIYSLVHGNLPISEDVSKITTKSDSTAGISNQNLTG
jgi:HAE1 family hydrophobic/amphiphilic exporter-1